MIDDCEQKNSNRKTHTTHCVVLYSIVTNQKRIKRKQGRKNVALVEVKTVFDVDGDKNHNKSNNNAEEFLQKFIRSTHDVGLVRLIVYANRISPM